MKNLVNSQELISENNMEKIIEWIIKIEKREANKYESDYIPKNEMISVESANLAELSSESISDSNEPEKAHICVNFFSSTSENKDQNTVSINEKEETDEQQQDENNYEEIKDTILNDIRRVILRNIDK